MKNGMVIILGLSLGILFSSMGYADNIRPEKSVVTKTVTTITTVESPIRDTLRNLRKRLENRRPLRRIHNRLRNILCINCVKDVTIVEQETEK